MDQTVTIKTPPTVFVTNGPELTFDLPLIPKQRFSVVGTAGILALNALFFWWILGAPISWLVLTLFGIREFDADRMLFSLLFTGFVLLFLSPVIEGTISVVATFFSRQPVLEIRPEGLVDRRILRRMVRWDEFESVGDQRHMAGRISMRGIHSFRLKDRGVRRFSPESAMHSFFLGGKRVVIHTHGFDIPPHQILDIILTMIRNANTERPAA